MTPITEVAQRVPSGAGRYNTTIVRMSDRDRISAMMITRLFDQAGIAVATDSVELGSN